jgi:hypothetical protein
VSDFYGNNRQFITTISSSVPPTVDLLIPSGYTYSPLAKILIIDSLGCEISKELDCNLIPPTPSYTPTNTPSPTPSVTPTPSIPLLEFTMSGNSLSAVTFSSFNTTNPLTVQWGDSTTTVYSAPLSTGVNHTYTGIYSSFTGTLRFKTTNYASITNITSTVTLTAGTISGLTVSTSELSKLSSLTTYQMGSFGNSVGRGFTTGRVSELPRSLTTIVMGYTDLSGNVSDIPTGSTFTRIEGNNVLSGGTSALPRPTGLTYIAVTGQNTISGLTSDLPQLSSFSIVSITGQNTITGPVSGFPSNLTYIQIEGNNTISGNTIDFPTTLTDRCIVRGNSNISGPISGIPRTSKVIRLDGTNNGEIFGNVVDIPSGATSFITAYNSNITGGTEQLFSGLTQFRVFGPSSNVTGTTNSLPRNITIFEMTGNTLGDITGNLSGFPTTIQQIVIYDGNSISGETTGLSGATNLNTISLYGNNTIFGSITGFPLNNLINLSLGGANQVTGYTSGQTWTNGMVAVKISSSVVGAGFTSNAIDGLLIDLSNYTWSSDGEIFLEGIDSPKRTTASDSAYSSLISQGVDITLV